jgi:hypothetical protein
MFLKSRQVRFRRVILPCLAERSSAWGLLDRDANSASCAQREAAAASTALAPTAVWNPPVPGFRYSTRYRLLVKILLMRNLMTGWQILD